MVTLTVLLKSESDSNSDIDSDGDSTGYGTGYSDSDMSDRKMKVIRKMTVTFKLIATVIVTE